MHNMFYNCLYLTSIDLSSFITFKVQNMNYMLYSCPSLNYIDVSNFTTSLDEIDLSDFQAENGILKIKEEFLNLLKVRPNDNWTIYSY